MVAAVFLKPAPGGVAHDPVEVGEARAAARCVAAAIYFAIALVIDHSGKNAAWQLADSSRNMIHVVAAAAASTFGSAYGLAAPYLGLLAGFISGSETSAIAMLSRFHTETATALGKPITVGLAARGRRWGRAGDWPR